MAEFLTFRDDAAFVGMERKWPQLPSCWHKTGLYHDPVWRTNDNTLWPDLTAFLAANGGARDAV